LSRAELQRLVAEVVGARTTKARSRLEGLDERRVDIIVPGAVLLEQVFLEFDVDQLTYSDYALREGVLLDRAGWVDVPSGAARSRLRDPRRAGVEHLADRFDPDLTHARHATELALTLFDQTAHVHGLGAEDRELLAAAGMLHNVGLAISHASHHRHSYYVIRNSDLLTGFNNHEIELIAQVARYHRKSTPRPKHEEFAGLSLRDRLVVRVLSGILRVAIGLDRTHAGVVRSLRATVDDARQRLVVRLDVEPGADASLELYTAEERCSLLAETLDLDVEFAVA
jgi:exopolyphosphatase/guanosine-5'-triphosphate,3'-diphosphate pyrophosphatase